MLKRIFSKISGVFPHLIQLLPLLSSKVKPHFGFQQTDQLQAGLILLGTSLNIADST
jgi:hypothetical protein